jgi:hypothetical protein
MGAWKGKTVGHRLLDEFYIKKEKVAEILATSMI